ncbi:MAG: response regulator transcription factor [Planctomycetes bacterium]|nr:response regulator transcription factor [Planctomycetota bacterium]MBL7008156.1 response regulator transcription factor [Planctomycetota bacterium]
MSPESAAGARVLIVEDEEALRLALGDALRSEGFTVLEAEDGEAGYELAVREDPDLVLLDLMLPRRDGYSVLKGLRQDRLTVPVMILSARGEEWDRVQGFEFGADDYLVKPFSMRELLMRVQALLRRAKGGTPGIQERGRARFGAVEVDFAGYSLTREGVRHGLSRKELDLLRYFLDHEGQALERGVILDAVWGADEFPTTRTIDTHVLKLRKKIEAHPDQPEFLLTVHGVGYKFVATP